MTASQGPPALRRCQKRGGSGPNNTSGRARQQAFGCFAVVRLALPATVSLGGAKSCTGWQGTRVDMNIVVAGMTAASGTQHAPAGGPMPAMGSNASLLDRGAAAAARTADIPINPHDPLCCPIQSCSRHSRPFPRPSQLNEASAAAACVSPHHEPCHAAHGARDAAGSARLRCRWCACKRRTTPRPL